MIARHKRLGHKVLRKTCFPTVETRRHTIASNCYSVAVSQKKNCRFTSHSYNCRCHQARTRIFFRHWICHRPAHNECETLPWVITQSSPLVVPCLLSSDHKNIHVKHLDFKENGKCPELVSHKLAHLDSGSTRHPSQVTPASHQSRDFSGIVG